MTEAQLKNALLKAHEKGDTEAAQLFANKIKELRSQETDPVMERVNENMGALESLAVATGRGMYDLARGVGLVEEESEGVKRAFEDLEERRPVSQMIGRAVGQSAPFLLPGGAIGAIGSTAGRVGATAALGAAEGGLISKGMGGEDEEIAKSAGIGGALAGGLELVSPVLGRAARKLINRSLGRNPTAPLFRNGKVSKELEKALDKEGLTLDDFTQQNRELLEAGEYLEPEQIVRQKFLEEQGIIPTKAQVTGDPSTFQAQQELYKTSGPVREAIEGQDVALLGGFENAITGTGGSAAQEINPINDFIADHAIGLDAAINQAYKEAGEMALDEKVVSLKNLMSELRASAGDERVTGGLISATKGALRRKGVLTNRGWYSAGRITPESAHEIRKDLNSYYDSLTDVGKQRLAKFKNALDSDVIEAAGEDVFSDAIKMKREFERSLDRAKVNKFDSRKGSIVRDILANKVDPDRLTEKLALSKATRVDDVKQVKDFLFSTGDDAGVAAWNDFRAEVMEMIKDSAFTFVNDVPALNKNQLDKIINRIGEKKLRVIFTPPELKFLRDMKKVATLREPARATALGKGPSAQAVGQLVKPMQRAAENVSLIAQIFGDAIAAIKGTAPITPPQNVKRLPLSSAGAVPLIPFTTESREQDEDK